MTPAPDTSRTPVLRQTDWTQLTLVCFASFIVWTGFGAILPYLPVFLQEQAHAPVWMIGVIASMYYAGTFLFSSPLGRLSDRIGRKPVIVSGMFLYALATLLFVTTTNAWWFLLFRLCEGIGAASVGPAGSAYIADISNDDTRGRAYGLLTSAQFGGLVAGPAMAILLNTLAGGGRHGFYAIFLVGSAMTLAMGFLLLAFLKEPAHATARRKEKIARPSYRSLASPSIVAFLVVAATSHFAMGGFEVLWSLWLRRLGASMAYVSATWMAFSVPMLFSFAGGMLAEKGNRFRLMFAGYAFSACSWIVYGFTRNLTVFMLFNVFEGIAVAISTGQAGLPRAVQPAALAGHRSGHGPDLDAARRPGRHPHGAPPVHLDQRLRHRRRWLSGAGRTRRHGSGPQSQMVGDLARREALSLAEAERLAAAPSLAAFDDERSPAR